MAGEVAENKDTIDEILSRSKVGQCGKCKGFDEPDLKDLCPACLLELESVTDEIFSASPELRRLGDAMSRRD